MRLHIRIASKSSVEEATAIPLEDSESNTDPSIKEESALSKNCEFLEKDSRLMAVFLGPLRPNRTERPGSKCPSKRIESSEALYGSTTFHPGVIAAHVSSILPEIVHPDLLWTSTARFTISLSERPVQDALLSALRAAHDRAELDFRPWPIGTSLITSHPMTDGRGYPFSSQIDDTSERIPCLSSGLLISKS